MGKKSAKKKKKSPNFIQGQSPLGRSHSTPKQADDESEDFTSNFSLSSNTEKTNSTQHLSSLQNVEFTTVDYISHVMRALILHSFYLKHKLEKCDVPYANTLNSSKPEYGRATSKLQKDDSISELKGEASVQSKGVHRDEQERAKAYLAQILEKRSIEDETHEEYLRSLKKLESENEELKRALISEKEKESKIERLAKKVDTLKKEIFKIQVAKRSSRYFPSKSDTEHLSTVAVPSPNDSSLAKSVPPMDLNQNNISYSTSLSFAELELNDSAVSASESTDLPDNELTSYPATFNSAQVQSHNDFFEPIFEEVADWDIPVYEPSDSQSQETILLQEVDGIADKVAKSSTDSELSESKQNENGYSSETLSFSNDGFVGTIQIEYESLPSHPRVLSEDERRREEFKRAADAKMLDEQKRLQKIAELEEQERQRALKEANIKKELEKHRQPPPLQLTPEQEAERQKIRKRFLMEKLLDEKIKVESYNRSKIDANIALYEMDEQVLFEHLKNKIKPDDLPKEGMVIKPLLLKANQAEELHKKLCHFLRSMQDRGSDDYNENPVVDLNPAYVHKVINDEAIEMITTLLLSQSLTPEEHQLYKLNLEYLFIDAYKLGFETGFHALHEPFCADVVSHIKNINFNEPQE